MNTESVESYLRDGCGRCDKYQTPDCKVLLWTDALKALRVLVLDAGLNEEMKWGSPTYTLDGQNLMQIASFKDFCSLSFFKGVGLSDPDGLLVRPGPNSRYARYFKFTSAEEVTRQREVVVDFIAQAIAIERDGVVIEPDVLPELETAELDRRLESDPALAAAFEALTPGRQRSHRLHVSGAKAAATRERRVEKCVPKIMAGKGFNER